MILKDLMSSTFNIIIITIEEHCDFNCYLEHYICPQYNQRTDQNIILLLRKMIT